MEKNTPHYRLDGIKAIVTRYGADALTVAARLGARQMKLPLDEAIAVIMALTRRQFYKSMTTHADHRVWQDVYHACCPNGRWAYIKLTMYAEGAVVIQFKEL